MVKSGFRLTTSEQVVIYVLAMVCGGCMGLSLLLLLGGWSYNSCDTYILEIISILSFSSTMALIAVLNTFSFSVDVEEVLDTTREEQKEIREDMSNIADRISELNRRINDLRSDIGILKVLAEAEED